jgi:hypothetical protein
MIGFNGSPTRPLYLIAYDTAAPPGQTGDAADEASAAETANPVSPATLATKPAETKVARDAEFARRD